MFNPRSQMECIVRSVVKFNSDVSRHLARLRCIPRLSHHVVPFPCDVSLCIIRQIATTFGDDFR